MNERLLDYNGIDVANMRLILEHQIKVMDERLLKVEQIIGDLIKSVDDLQKAAGRLGAITTPIIPIGGALNERAR